jgi:hypothetical protein
MRYGLDVAELRFVRPGLNDVFEAVADLRGSRGPCQFGAGQEPGPRALDRHSARP